MAAFLLRRLAQAVLVMLAVGLIAFSLFRFVGDPVLFMLGQDTTPEDRARITQMLGLDQPFYVQYAKFLGNALQGEFGLSLRQAQPVSKLIMERLPATLELSLIAASFAVIAGIAMGVYTALRRNTWLSQMLLADYIKFARARGLTDRAVHFGHALKNTLVPVITITGLQLGAIIAFAIITETVFQWPGMGLLFIQAVGVADVPVMAAYLCLIALFFVVINLVVDLLYYAVDPRLRIERSAMAH